MFEPQTLIEPFKIKSIERLKFLTRSERRDALKRAHFNLYRLRSEEILIDLLTDSGVAAMSAEQWAALMQGDESYAGSQSFEEFKTSIEEVTGLSEVIPTPQGRVAERILFQVFASRWKNSVSGMIPSNSHFDTTRWNLEAAGFEGVDFPCAESQDLKSSFPFKGNMNLVALENFLESKAASVPLGMMTLTNNSFGGQPASFENIQATSQIFRKYKIPFYLDACRFAENIAFILKKERPQENPQDLAKNIFKLCDGCIFSAKKDGLANIGGFLASGSTELMESFKINLIQTEGFPTYGGLAGRDLAAIAQGLKEVLDPTYLRYRLAMTEYLGKRLDAMEIPFIHPPGGHAIVIDAGSLLSHLKWNEYPAQALALALYLEGGIRTSEVGSVMFGRKPDGREEAHRGEWLRLSIPRRVYTTSHLDYVLETLGFVAARRKEIPGVKIVKEPPRLRHFSADFLWSVKLEPRET